MNIVITSASLFLTDKAPLGESLIALNIIKRLAQNHELTVMAPDIDLSGNIKNTDFIKCGGLKFTPYKGEINFKLKMWLYQAICYFKLKKIMKQKKVDIVHHLFPFDSEREFTFCRPDIIGPAFLNWELSEDDYSGISFRPGILKKIKRKIIQADNFIISRLNRKLLIKTTQILVTLDKLKKSFPSSLKNKIHTFPVGVDTEYFKPAADPDIFTILFLAYMVKRKGLDYLIDAAEILKKEKKRFKVIAVGDGPDLNYFKEKVKEKEMKEYFQWPGFVKNEETLKYYQKSSVYVLPSLGEPFGLSVLEAMACGLPVLGFNAGGLPHIAPEKNKKFLAPLKDSVQLARNIMFIMNNRREAGEISAQNRREAEGKYDWKIVMKILEKCYNNIKLTKMGEK